MPERMRGFRIAGPKGSPAEQFRIYPSAELLINRWISRGVSKSTINPGEDVTICSAAIIASAIEVARERRSRVISVNDVHTAWTTILAYDLCTPPWRCMARSVTGRIDKLRGEVPGFEQVLEQLK